jgi:hypothetical protein
MTHEHDHHPNPEIKVATPNPNTGGGVPQVPSHPDDCHLVPPEFGIPNLAAVVTLEPENRIKIVIQFSAQQVTYIVTPTGNMLQVIAAEPVGIASVRGYNGEIYIQPKNLN